MNYVVKCDGQTLYNEYSEDCFIIDDELELVANELGSFSFSIYPDHPLYNSIELKKSKIKLYKDDELMMIFRPMEQHDDINDLRTFYCEGCLSYLKDSLMRPFDFSGSPATFFHNIISQHNSQVSSFQRFIEGSCTVTDPNNYIKRSSTFYNQTWDIVTDKMLNMGGYLIVTFDQNENPILSWLASISDVCSQEIALGENLTSYERSLIYSDFCTACVPLGAQKADGTRLTIEDVNEDHDYVDYLINDDLAAIYGVIYAKPDDTTWDDVTNDWNLLTKGERWLDESGVKYKKNIMLTAEDISFLNVNLDSFEFMKKVYFKNSAGVSSDYIIAKMSFAITNKYSLNVELVDESYEYVPKNFTAISTKHNRTVSEKVQKAEEDKVNKENVLDALNDVASEPGSYFSIDSIGVNEADIDDAIINRTLNIPRERCFVTPNNGVGWYRVYKLHWKCSDTDEAMANGNLAFTLDIALQSHTKIDQSIEDIHRIVLNKLHNSATFDCECSKSNALQIDKIRYVEDVNITPAVPEGQSGLHYDHRWAYIDVHFAIVNDLWTNCVFDLKAKDNGIPALFDTVRNSLKVADVPQDQNIVSTYTFKQNVNKFSSLDVVGTSNLNSLNVGGVLNQSHRRSALVSNVSAGWHRVLEFAPTTVAHRFGRAGIIIDFDITRFGTQNETHHVSLSLIETNAKFYGEFSNSNTQLIDKIRYTYDSNKGYVDIHLSSSWSANVAVDYQVSASAGSFRGQITTKSLAAVADSPSGETVLTEYALNANGAGDITYNGDVTVGGVLDVTNRRAAGNLSTAGWYRVMTYAGTSTYQPDGATGALIRFNVVVWGNTSANGNHQIDLSTAYGTGHREFVNEFSNGQDTLIDKIRYTKKGNNFYVDVHFTGNSNNLVTVYFDPYIHAGYQDNITSEGLDAVADAPDGETVVTTYTFSKTGAHFGNLFSNGIQLFGLLSGGTAITSNANLNNYTDPGVYTCTSAVAATLTNSNITTVGFKMLVMDNGTGTTERWQICFASYSNCIIAVRWRNSSGVWQAWKRFTPA